MTLKLLSSLTDSVSISVRLCLPSKSVCLQFCKVLSAFWMAWVQQDLTILTFMTFSLKEWSILITWIKNNSINIWMCFTLLVRYWLSSYDDQFQRLLAESIPILVGFFFFFLYLLHPTPIPFAECGRILMHTQVFSSDNIWTGLHTAWTKPHKVSGKIPVVSVVFEWSCYAANSWGYLA